jgi:protein-tyrosine phosphatase
MKKTHQKDRDVPGPEHRWNEIRPHLWMGGHYWTGSAGELQLAVVKNQFDLVVSLHVEPGHGPAPGIEHRILEIPDKPLNADQIDQVRQLAVVVSAAIRNGRATLVRCYAGYNRSGLVIAQALVNLGMNIGDAIALIRRRRSPHALHNKTFEDYLRTGLDVAHLLTGLDSPV